MLTCPTRVPSRTATGWVPVPAPPVEGDSNRLGGSDRPPAGRRPLAVAAPGPRGRPADAPDLAELQEVAAGLRRWLAPTPLLPSAALSARLGREVLVKAEALQPTGSFKVRGALAAVTALTRRPASGSVRLVAASAGNHGQGVALAAARLGLGCDVFMPVSAPAVKREGTAALGAVVHTVDGGVTTALAAARAWAAARRGHRFVHPFDDRDVVLGQAGVALEVLAARPDTAALVVPVGGGGLLAGTAAAARATGSTARVVGVQAGQATALAASLLAGGRRRVHPSTLADGLAVAAPGALPLRWVRELADAVLTVGDEDVLAAMRHAVRHERLVLEPAGATALAALLDAAPGAPLPGPPLAPGPLVVVATGGNVDPALLARALGPSCGSTAPYGREVESSNR